MDCQSQVESPGTEGVSENSLLIAELQQRVDILDRRVNEALERAGWNQPHAAEQLGMTRRSLKIKMDRYALKPPQG